MLSYFPHQLRAWDSLSRGQQILSWGVVYIVTSLSCNRGPCTSSANGHCTFCNLFLFSREETTWRCNIGYLLLYMEIIQGWLCVSQETWLMSFLFLFVIRTILEFGNPTQDDLSVCTLKLSDWIWMSLWKHEGDKGGLPCHNLLCYAKFCWFCLDQGYAEVWFLLVLLLVSQLAKRRDLSLGRAIGERF